MAGRHFGAVLRRVERLFAAGTVSGLSEGQLIERFATRGDEAAFEALLARHGPMVLGICRRVLHDPDDVEDAFQATFLVLVRKAGTLRDRDLVGNWLFGVASRVALRARAVAARRRAVEGSGTPVDAPAPGDDRDRDRESRTMIHEEVRRLPEKYRSPVVLCYLEGLSHAEAAQQLGWPVGTVKGRLARARELLRGRLTRRGVTLSAGALAAELARDVRAAVPAALVESTIRAALPVAAGRVLATGAVAANVAALTEGVLNVMFWTKLKSAAAGLLAVGIVTVGVGGWAYQAAGKNDGPPVEPPAAAAATATATATVEVVEFAALVQKSQETFSGLLERTRANQGRFDDLERLIRWSSHVLESQLDLSEDKAERRAALVAHRDRMTRLHELTQSLPVSDPDQPVKADLARVHRQMAERKLAEATAAESKPSRPKEVTGDPAAPTPAAPAPKSVEAEPGKLKSQAIAKALDEPISLSFAKETALEDVLERIKTAKQSPNGSGIPIYVDPAVREKLKELVQIDLEGVPLRTILALLLSQVGLEAGIQDGLLIISTEEGLQDYRDIASHFTPLPKYLGPGSMRDEMSPVGKSEATLAKLARTITLSFPEETPLDTVLRAIRQAAKGPKEAAIPLYVGPRVMIWNEVDKAEEKTIGTLPVQIDLKDVPVRTCLTLLLSQQRRKYANDSNWYNVVDGRIIDGLLIIGPRDWLQSLPTNQAGFGGGMGQGMGGMGRRGGQGMR